MSVFPTHQVDFGPVIAHKQALLRRSFEYFKTHATADQRVWFEAFREQNVSWLADYGLFMALKGNFGGGSWHDWPRDIRVREPGAVANYRGQVGEWATYHEYVQWLFADQWRALKTYANALGIQIIGDIPIFVAEDSADVWARPGQFQLDARATRP